MTTLSTSPLRHGRHGRPDRSRLRAAWAAAHAPVEGVPRWARIAAYTVALCVLPSSVWRITGMTFHVPIVDGADATGDPAGNLPGWLPLEVYVVLLSVVSEVFAFTAIGLVAAWGEAFPRWIPLLRGRRVPISFAVVTAALGAVAVTVLWWVAGVNALFGRTIQGDAAVTHPLNFDTWRGMLAMGAYLPLMLWGPLLAALTVAYWRRRRAERPAYAAAGAA